MKDRTEYFRNYRVANKEKLALKNKLWWANNPTKSREYARKRREQNPDENKLKMQAWRAKNPERNREIRQACYWRDPEKWRANRRRYPFKRDDQAREQYRIWAANKRATDSNFKLLNNLRTRLYLALKGKTKSAPTLRLIGCSIEYLWLYLESRFEEGMTRENYGSVWEVDHIIPCALFDFTKEDHQKRCFFFGNLQPLFAAKNRSKGARLVNQQQERMG